MDSQIRNFIKGLNLSEGAKYSEYETKVMSEYNGCADSRYSDLFLTKLWNKLNDIVFLKESYEPVSVFLTNSLGAKILKYAPKNSEIYAMNNDFYCHIVSKAILQRIKLDWVPNVIFGNIANYFYMEYDKFISNRYDLIVNTYEDENAYYKSIDNDKSADLPYYQYCFVRSILFTEKYICSIVPNKYAEELKRFIYGNVINYTDKKLFLETTITDADYTAYLLKIQ